jgi:CO/xanthine dehydrogenase FAD-binding subunit
LQGKAATEDAVKEAVQTVADGIDVLGDIHASPEYRAHLARVLTRRAVLDAARRARG